MIVLGNTVPPAMIAACIKRMRARSFTACDIEQTAWECNSSISNVVLYRIADRMIQRERKAGNIRYANKLWTWVNK